MTNLYEMHVAFLRISYLCQKELFCMEVSTTLQHRGDYDLTSVRARYTCAIYIKTVPWYLSKQFNDLDIVMCCDGSTLTELVEDARKKLIIYRNEQLTVNKSKELLQPKDIS